MDTLRTDLLAVIRFLMVLGFGLAMGFVVSVLYIFGKPLI